MKKNHPVIEFSLILSKSIFRWDIDLSISMESKFNEAEVKNLIGSHHWPVFDKTSDSLNCANLGFPTPPNSS